MANRTRDFWQIQNNISSNFGKGQENWANSLHTLDSKWNFLSILNWLDQKTLKKMTYCRYKLKWNFLAYYIFCAKYSALYPILIYNIFIAYNITTYVQSNIRPSIKIRSYDRNTIKKVYSLLPEFLTCVTLIRFPLLQNKQTWFCFVFDLLTAAQFSKIE